MAYLSTDHVAQIRAKLKETFPNVKFSVKKKDASLGVCVSVMSSEFTFSDYLDERGYSQVNEYRIENDFAGDERDFLLKVKEVIETGSDRKYYNNSDPMTDYFDYAFFYSINIGQYGKPYLCKKKSEDKIKSAIVEKSGIPSDNLCVMVVR